MPIKDRDKRNEYMNKWKKKKYHEVWKNDSAYKLRQKKIASSWYQKLKKDPERYQRRLEQSAKYRKTRRFQDNAYTKKHRGEERLQVLIHYGGNPPKCACPNCTETLIEFLTVDHINGGGSQHMKEIGGPSGFYHWLIKHNFPEGFRILCMNCNHSLGVHGYCPHSKLIRPLA